MANEKVLFSLPMTWREPTNHVLVRYFCLAKILGCSKPTKSCMSTHNAIPLYAFSLTFLKTSVLTSFPLSNQESYDNSEESTISSLGSGSPVAACDEELHSSPESVAPHLLNPKDLNNLVRDLGLVKDKLKLVAS